jgi:hypothetical protein
MANAASQLVQRERRVRQCIEKILGDGAGGRLEIEQGLFLKPCRCGAGYINSLFKLFRAAAR